MKGFLINEVIEKIESVNAKDWENYIREDIKIKGFFNPITETEYKGLNKLTLLIDFIFNKRKSYKYATFKQISENELKLKKGSKGITIEYFNRSIKNINTQKTIQKDEFLALTDSEKQNYTITKFLKSYKVFNFDDIENYKDEENFSEIENFSSEEENIFLNNLIEKNQIDCEYYDNSVACYSPSNHKIYMPFKEYFKNNDAFLATYFHEIIHWTKKDIKRDFENLKNNKYALEELVAEMGSMLLMFEINNYNEFKNSLCYLKGWLKNSDDKVNQLTKAFSNSKKAVNFLINKESSI